MAGNDSSTLERTWGWTYANWRLVSKLVFYLVLVGGGTLFAADLMRRAWLHSPSGLRQLFLFLPVHPAVIYFPIVGLFAGLIAVLLIDSYKRAQGIFLVLGILVSIPTVMFRYDVLINTLLNGFTTLSGGLFVVALLVGIGLGGVNRTRLEKQEDYEFPEAPRRLLILTGIVLLIGGFEAIVIYRPAIIAPDFRPPLFYGFVTEQALWIDVGMTVLGFFGLSKFASYENRSRVIQIGPARSGKSAAFGGMQVAVTDKIDEMAALKSNPAVTELSNSIKRGEFPDRTERVDTDFLSINYKSEGPFPAKMSINGVDYAGELLDDILFSNLGPQSTSPSVRADGGDQESQDNTDERDTPSFYEEDGEEDESGFNVEEFIEEEKEDLSEEELGLHSVEETDDWDEAISQLERVTAAANPTSEDIPPAVWECISHADQIVLTVPLEDFIGPVVARGNHPEYFDIKKREEDEGAERDNGIVRLDDGEDLTLHQVQNLYNVGEGPELARHEYEDRVYYRVNPPERSDPEEYLQWYKTLVREYRKKKEFIVLVTMADWMTIDYKRETGNVPGVTYDDFCEYISNVVSAQQPIFDDILLGTSDRRIYATWYEIENDAPPTSEQSLRIDQSINRSGKTRTLLQGADMILDQLGR